MWSASTLRIPGTKLYLSMTKLYILLTSWSYDDDLLLPVIYIVYTAVVLRDNTFIWVWHKCLHKLLSPSKTSFSSKTLACKSDSSSTKCLAAVSLSKSAPQPYLEVSFFNKKRQFGIFVGLNKSPILFIHDKISIFPGCENLLSFSQNFLWQIGVREFYHVPMTCNAMDQNAMQKTTCKFT